MYCASWPPTAIIVPALFLTGFDFSMSLNQRQHIRFSLDIPAFIYSKYGEKQETRLEQISIGGCFMSWDSDILIGDELRIEIEMPDKNYLPLYGRAIYRFDNTGIGVKFMDICEFEQELVSKIIAGRLELEGVPLQIDPFTLPPTFVGDDPSPRVTDIRQKRDAVLQRIMAGTDW